MGEEIGSEPFTEAGEARFALNLKRETEILLEWLADSTAAPSEIPRLGFEIEAWLVDSKQRPLAANDTFLEALAHPLATEELALFNVEFGSSVFTLQSDCFSRILEEWQTTLNFARETIQGLKGDLVLMGSLPTLVGSDLNLGNMSNRSRYHGLNEAVLRLRALRPLRLDIDGHHPLHEEHSDVMLEAAATSFQIHMETHPGMAHCLYNAAVTASAPVLAAAGNTPYLFQHRLWEETRIPLFEQAVEVGGFGESARGPVRRVSLGSRYLQSSIAEIFVENLEHFPILLPAQLAERDPSLPHLRLHNGTIWRWVRPIVSRDESGRLRMRIEHRCLPAGPTLQDMLANTAFLLGLVEHLIAQPGYANAGLEFPENRDQFYAAARHGLGARMRWGSLQALPSRTLILRHLLPLAAEGLDRLGVDPTERDHLLGLISARVSSGQTGSVWQQRWIERHGHDWPGLVCAYKERQWVGHPVHTWDTE